MKKLTKLSALLLVGAVVFMGCKNQPAEEPESIPGEWIAVPTLQSSFKNPFTGATLTANGNTFVFECAAPNTSLSSSEQPNYNCITGPMYKVTDDTYKGFKAKVKCDSDDTYFAFIFNGSIKEGNKWTCYEVIVHDQQFQINKDIDDKWTTLQDWTRFNNIHQNSELNEVIVYRDDDGNMGLSFNGKTATKIKDSVLEPGFFGVSCYIEYNEWFNNTPVTATYEFTEVQVNQ